MLNVRNNMPLKQLYKGAKAKTILLTCGPWAGDKEWYKQDTLTFIKKTQWGPRIRRSHVVAEIGAERENCYDSNYKHLHVAIEFDSNDIRPFQLKFDLQKYMVENWSQYRDPEEQRKFNADIHRVPNDEPDMKGRTNYDHILLKYVTAPTKDKEVDQSLMTGDIACDTFRRLFTEEQWNYMCRLQQPSPIVSIGERMAKDYKFYKSVDPYYRRVFDLKYQGVIFWKK